MPIIALLTDFGTRDEYVGLMKGVILSINPSVTIVDITHYIDSQDIAQAAYAIHSAYRYFPTGSVHLIVVDPGVGTERSLIVLEMRGQYFVAPDNGVLTLLFEEETPTNLVRLTNSAFFLETVSRTFHGRDIIAPVGAHITKGVDLNQLGDKILPANAVRLENFHPQTSSDGTIIGTIVTVDHFGNLISNIGSRLLSQVARKYRKEAVTIHIGAHTIHGIEKTYEDGPSDVAMALIGSRGYLEIAVNQGNASRVLNAHKGDPVEVII